MEWVDAAPHEVAFWSGAGVSADPPTNGPLGPALTHRALDYYMAEGTRRELGWLYHELQVANANARPRLETVLDAVTDVYGLGGLADVLSDLAGAVPNVHHEFLARHVRAGGYHITTNFDLCVEHAISTFDDNDRDRVIHVHGSIRGDLSALGARLRVIENGLPEQLVRRLDEVLGSPDVRYLVFIGYSGSDFFDVTPYLLSRVDLLRTKAVVWHEYRNGPLNWQVDPAEVQRDLLRKLVDAGLEVQVVSGQLGDLFALSSASWATSPGRNEPCDLAPLWTPSVERSGPLRRAATTALYSRMGYRKGVIDGYAHHAPGDPRDWDRLADAFWGAGRYREALNAWEHAFAGDDSTSKARRAERQGAILWIRGRYLAAESRLWKAIDKWCVPRSAASLEASAVLLETYGRVIEHMRRMPDARWFIRPSRVAEAQRRLTDVARNLEGREGVALRARLANVGSALRGQADTQLADHITAFAESEALHSWLNYEHARLRWRASHPGGAEHVPGCDDYEMQAERQKVIGATADVARTYLLPGASRFFTPKEVWRAFRPVEMTPWHRIRLVGGYTTLWLAARLQARRSQ